MKGLIRLGLVVSVSASLNAPHQLDRGRGKSTELLAGAPGSALRHGPVDKRM